MPRPIRSFAVRQAAAERRQAIKAMSITERLLALVLVETMAARGYRTAIISRRLSGIGLPKPAIAGLLNTTVNTLAIFEFRHKRSKASAK